MYQLTFYITSIFQILFYSPNFILFFFVLNLFYFILSPLPPLRKGSHCGSVNTEFTRWDVDRNSLERGIPSGNNNFNGLGFNREFPKGGNPKRGIPRWLMGISLGNSQQRWQHLLPSVFFFFLSLKAPAVCIHNIYAIIHLL